MNPEAESVQTAETNSYALADSQKRQHEKNYLAEIERRWLEHKVEYTIPGINIHCRRKWNDGEYCGHEELAEADMDWLIKRLSDLLAICNVFLRKQFIDPDSPYMQEMQRAVDKAEGSEP